MRSLLSIRTRGVRRAGAALVLGALLLAPATPAAVAAPAAAPLPADRHQPEGDPDVLRDAAPRGLFVGTAVDMAALANDPVYRERVGAEFSSVTAENVMKWETLQPERGRYDFAAADELVEFARANGQRVRGHTLVWHNQNPAWLAEGDFSRQELRAILREHIHTVVGRYRGQIWQWDVANEIFDDEGNLRQNIWLETIGPDYIADAFRWAHQADPRAQLFLNDYNIEGVNAKSDAYYELARQLRREGVPVHGVGVQGHLGVQYGFAPDTTANLQRFAALGLRTAVTEADVRIPMPADTVELQAQAQGYSSLLTACLRTPRCDSFTVWGFTDRYSWVPDWFEGEGAANLLDEDYNPKPAYREVLETLALASGRGRD
ncbi:endo-1,4-beta-xylanase [Allonocardiopsis opalescens]|uniref:Beta-xylanase n=1 Tax=Allonocardiopsis opalescens TaxID=1144618 RepID=A0A2T0QAI0_9ACTN|nr:endo-1,4-beta-xylanase [Allonocardiopsis opalescens]PRY00898.1 endo-1,4-beta-xylanase [Allonocardiopsis opalescens]